MNVFNRSIFRHWLRKIYFKFWWFDVVYPLLLSFLLFWSLSYLLYSGQKHRRVSSQIEARFLYWSLNYASPRLLEKAPDFLTISLVEEDFKQLNQFSIHDHRDTSLIYYSFLLNKLLDLGVQRIFLHWQADAFPHEAHYNPFYPIIEKAKRLGKELYYVVHPSFINSLPLKFRSQANVLEADPCDTSLQVYCVFNQQWKKWIMQKLATLYWNPKSSPMFLESISKNLPSQTLAYILHYNDYNDFIDYSFRDILEMDETEIKAHRNMFEGRNVFVGNSLIQGKKGMMKAADINRVKTVLDPFYSSARNFGTPLHKYWAQHAQMFHDDALVHVAPFSLTTSLAVLLALLIVLILHYCGAVYSLVCFLLFACLGPAYNILLIRYFHSYIPIFDALYAGFLSFLLTTFAKLSIESFHHWRLRIKQRSNLELLSAKTHFISLLSHNLNTPVAKMQGILSVVEQYGAENASFRKSMNEAQSLISNIQLSIQSVLTTTALEEKELGAEAIVLKPFLKTYRESMSKTLQRLHIPVDFCIEDNEFTEIPVRFDRKALTMGLTSFLILFQPTSQVSLEIENDENKMKLIIKTESDFDTFQEFLKRFENMEFRESLLEELAHAVLKGFACAYHGQWSWEEGQLLLRIESEAFHN